METLVDSSELGIRDKDDVLVAEREFLGQRIGFNLRVEAQPTLAFYRLSLADRIARSALTVPRVTVPRRFESRGRRHSPVAGMLG